MTARDDTAVLRPKSPFKKWLGTRIFGLFPLGFAVLRRFAPIVKSKGMVLVTLHDDVREVFASDASFGVPYNQKLQVITDDQPFFLGMGDTKEYRAGLKAMEAVVVKSDLSTLATRAEQLADEAVARAKGEIEVVQFIRDVTFALYGEYFGVPADRQVQIWATRLFEFQFADQGNDPGLADEVEVIAPAFRNMIDDLIARRKLSPTLGDDILGRCLARQAADEPGYSDREIRTNLLCMMVGGPPQPPMVVPQGLEQLLRRPAELAKAHVAASAGDDGQLHDILFEAMRFDPLAPALPRIALRDAWIARGTRRERRIAKGDAVYAGVSSAMMDASRLPDPKSFRIDRRAYEYMHFGHGLHECFGRHMNHATLHRMLKPLLGRSGLGRASGGSGRLLKNGPFAERLQVTFHTGIAPD
ncbi:MAG TPA: cytochrome P450 [Sphingomicrobium sp.]|nr:cytochrome P450 [Sphingomicrobium sp.]